MTGAGLLVRIRMARSPPRVVLRCYLIRDGMPRDDGNRARLWSRPPKGEPVAIADNNQALAGQWGLNKIVSGIRHLRTAHGGSRCVIAFKPVRQFLDLLAQLQFAALLQLPALRQKAEDGWKGMSFYRVADAVQEAHGIHSVGTTIF